MYTNRQARRDAIFSFAVMFKKCAQNGSKIRSEMRLVVLENYVIQQKFRPIPMKGRAFYKLHLV